MMKELLSNIKSIRLEKGYSQENIAEVLGIDVSNYGRIENGVTDLKMKQFVKIAEFLHISPIDLFTYPKKFVDSEKIEKNEKCSVTFEVSIEHREKLLELVNSTHTNRT